MFAIDSPPIVNAGAGVRLNSRYEHTTTTPETKRSIPGDFVQKTRASSFFWQLTMQSLAARTSTSWSRAFVVISLGGAAQAAVLVFRYQWCSAAARRGSQQSWIRYG